MEEHTAAASNDEIDVFTTQVEIRMRPIINFAQIGKSSLSGLMKIFDKLTVSNEGTIKERLTFQSAEDEFTIVVV